MSAWFAELLDPVTGSSLGRTLFANYFRAIEGATEHAVTCFASRGANCQLLWTTAPDGMLTKLELRDGPAVYLIARLERSDP